MPHFNEQKTSLEPLTGQHISTKHEFGNKVLVPRKMRADVVKFKKG